MRQTIRWALVLAVGLGLGACGDSSGPEDEDDISGTYTLQTINGSPLPFTLGEFEGFKLEIMSDVFLFNTNGTFRDISVVRETDNGVQTISTDTIIGTFTQVNNTIVLTAEEGESLTATLSGNNTMTAVGQGFTFVYRK